MGDRWDGPHGAARHAPNTKSQALGAGQVGGGRRRYWGTPERLVDKIRFTVGTPQQNTALLAALRGLR